MLNYLDLEALHAVVRTGSFEKAAEALGITASAVSQRITKLEKRASARLIVRGKPCSATDEGALLMQHIEKVRFMEQELAKCVPEIALLLQTREYSV